MSCWKQPIPTDLTEECLGHKFAANVFRLLILRARTTEGHAYIKGKPILLKRGQCFCGRNELASEFESTPDKIRGILDFLQNFTKQITKQKSRNCSIITVLNFDELTKITKLIPNQSPINPH